WRRLITARPKDPVSHTQVADLLRGAGINDEAAELYKKAIELAPDAAQYREYLGEFYHSLHKSDEALAAWREIAAGKNRTSKNLARLAEVFSGFGYLKEAVEAIGEACKLEADDFNLQSRHAELLAQNEQYEEALKQLDVAARLASTPEDAESVLQQQIRNLQATEQLSEQIEKLEKELNAGTDATAKRWLRLARFREAARQMSEATVAITKALELDNQSIPAWAAAARIHENGGNPLAAADANRKLAPVDPRFPTQYLTTVAQVRSRLGRRKEALQAGRDLLEAAPGNPEHYKFFAELCFQLGEREEGFEALRRSVRVNPSEPQVLLTLAAALADQYQTGEAIELYWRA